MLQAGELVEDNSGSFLIPMCELPSHRNHHVMHIMYGERMHVQGTSQFGYKSLKSKAFLGPKIQINEVYWELRTLPLENSQNVFNSEVFNCLESAAQARRKSLPNT